MAEFEATFVDVGCGDTTLIKLPGDGYMLVDVYRCPGQGIDLFKLLDDVLPEGDDGRKRLEVLVITHAHDDHIAGIGDLYDRYQIGELWLPQHSEELQRGTENHDEFVRIKDEHSDEKTLWPKGSRSVWKTLGDGDEVSVRCFSPPGYIEPAEELDEEEAKRLVHENCVVLRLSYSDYSLMLTGDSDKACWERIVGYYDGRTDDAGADVLKVESLHASHHGSRSFAKSDMDDEPYCESLDLMEPEHVVISVGAENKHDHPHADMLEIYGDAVGAENVVQTGELGTMRLEVEASGVARLITEEGPDYERDYGWDDDDGDRASGKSAGSVPPAAPPPGYEKRSQRAPRRERYGS
jgi:competence protein ComEC